MKHLLIPCIAVIIARSFLPATVHAQENREARFALHAKDKFTAIKAVPNLCNEPADPGFPNYSPNWEGLECPHYSLFRPTNEFPGPTVFLVVGQASANGVSGASCGVT